MIDILDRLGFDATRCELQFSKGVAGNITEAIAEIKRLRAASEWRVIYDEAKDELIAPADTELLLGWWQEWPELKWHQETGQCRNTRGGWAHGQATHFQPLPAPPQRNEVTKPSLEEPRG